ncbi:DUF6087 family protein [Streptomyces sp. MZ04]|uniref:DUF6087 family protein n=1 Tax=Streptomyces sp. MZ04 TaxID=2559236 RepID=UPI00107EDBC6|nr:DUF6087 family protein [Streptomyces sp. MZ04]TGB05595.1 hypothetical protein E2651_24810 [Streptomyces sp. MZ04]
MTADWPPELAERFGRRILARTYQPGRLRVVTLGQDPPRAAPVEPHQPRAVMRWTGKKGGWKLVAVVADLAATQAFKCPPRADNDQGDVELEPEPW